LIIPQQAKTESYLKGNEDRELGSAARDGMKKRGRTDRQEEQNRTETAAAALTWWALPSAPASRVISGVFFSAYVRFSGRRKISSLSSSSKVDLGSGLGRHVIWAE
jgi:hypothetical protein